jgi:hypothetical protein
MPRCDWTAFERAAAAMRGAREAAMATVTKDAPTDVPPETIGQIQAFKNGLRGAYEEYFRCQSPETPAPAALEESLYDKLALPRPKPPAQETADSDSQNGPSTGLYLTDIGIQVQVVPDARRLVAIKTTMQIPFGEDAALDIFAPSKDGHWEHVLHYTSDPYTSILGAFSGFEYRIAPQDEKGKWFVLVDYSNPWPSSCWQGLSFQVLRSSYGSTAAIDSEKGIFYYQCNDEPTYIKAIPKDGFQLQYSGFGKLSGIVLQQGTALVGPTEKQRERRALQTAEKLN